MADIELGELRKELTTMRRNLALKANDFKKLCEDYPHRESEYRMALAIKITGLRADGTAATLIPDLAKGDRHVAKLRLDRDIARGVKDACRSSQNAIEIAINAIQTEINSELREHELAGRYQP